MPTTQQPDYLPPDDKSLLIAADSIFSTLSAREQTAFIRFLCAWSATKAEQRALLLKILLPDMSDQMVAQIAGVARTTLYDWPAYKRLKAILTHVPEVRRGAVDGDGFILEAWYEDGG